VHQRCGHVLYEIPPIMLDRVMLISTEFAAVRGRRGDAQTSGKFADTRLVRWARRGDQVHLELVQFDMRAEGEPGLTHAVGRMSPGFLIRSFDVLSEGADGAPVIDVTSLFFRTCLPASRKSSGVGSEWFKWTRSDPTSRASRCSRKTSR
jgi:hypothetical protein